MFDSFVFPSPHRAPGRQRGEREVSEDKVTYPLDEEGDNLNSYGEKKENIFSAPGIRWTLEIFRRGEKKKLGESQRRARGSKIGKIQKMKSAFTRRCFPLSSAWD